MPITTVNSEKVSKIPVEQATGITKDVYLDIQSQKEMVPNVFKTLAHKPDILRSTWNKMSAIMKNDALPKKVKKLVALRVSVLNDAQYCINAHYNGLKQLGYPFEVLDKVKAGDYELVTEVEARILRFVDKAANNYKELTEDDFQEVALQEEELLELVAVIDLFSGFNRLTEILQIQLD